MRFSCHCGVSGTLEEGEFIHHLIQKTLSLGSLNVGLIHFDLPDWCSIPVAGPVPGAGARLGASVVELNM